MAKRKNAYGAISSDGNDSEHKGGSEHINFLPATFKPGEWDVICQRGGENYDHGR